MPWCEWEPLSDRNPVPGDPNAVVNLSQRLSTDAATIRAQLDALKGKTSTEFWSGMAAEGFRAHEGKLPELLGQIATRYQKVANALWAYAPGLGEAQGQARAALRRAQEAQVDLLAAQRGAETAAEQARADQAGLDAWNQAHPDMLRTPQATIGPNWSAHADAARHELAVARSMLEDAKTIRDNAASRCAHAIGEAIDDGIKNPGGIFHAIGHIASDIGHAGSVVAHEAGHLAGDVERWGLEYLPVVSQALGVAAGITGLLGVL